MRRDLRHPYLATYFAIHYAWVAYVWSAEGRAEECLWLSHLSLLLAAAGFVLGSPLVLGGTLIGILVFHALWCFDATTWLLTEEFPMGITYYLKYASAGQWVATLHHYFLFPLLAWVLLRRRALKWTAWLFATGAFAGAVTLARLFTPADANVNGAFAPPPGLRGSFLDPLLQAVLDRTGEDGGLAWPACMVVLCAIGNFLPVLAALLLLQPLVPRRATRGK